MLGCVSEELETNRAFRGGCTTDSKVTKNRMLGRWCPPKKGYMPSSLPIPNGNEGCKDKSLAARKTYKNHLVTRLRLIYPMPLDSTWNKFIHKPSNLMNPDL